MKNNFQEFARYLEPTGGLVVTSLVAALAGVVFLLASNLYKGSDVQFLVELSRMQQDSVHQQYQVANSTFANSALSNLPLLILWAGVGLIAYWLGSVVMRTILQGEQIRHEMEYVHANPKTVWHQAAERLAFRVLILIMWVLFVRLCVHAIAPYITALVSASKVEQLLTAILYILIAISIGTVAWYTNIVFARLLFLRNRLFN